MINNKIYTIFLFCIITLLSILFFYIPDDENNPFQIFVLTIALFTTVVHFYFTKINSESFNWLSINTVFILGFYIVFFQIPITHVLGFKLPTRYFYYIWGDHWVVNKSMWLSTLALVSYFFGYSIFLIKRTRYSEGITFKEPSIFLLILFTYIFYFLFLINSGSYMYGEYTPDDATGFSSYFYKLFKIALSACLIIKVCSLTHIDKNDVNIRLFIKSLGKPLGAILLFFLLFSLFVGDRSPVIYFCLLSFGVYIIRFKRFSLPSIVLILVFLSLFLTIIGEVRQSRTSGDHYLTRLNASLVGLSDESNESRMYGQQVPGDSTLELAMSIRTLNHSLLNVPSNYDYFLGKFQSKYIYSIVPGVSGVVNSLFYNSNSMNFENSSNFITFLIQGKDPISGDGSSTIADLYVDFGVIGVLIGFIIFGLFVGGNEWKLSLGRQKATFLFIATLVFFSNSLYINRSTFLMDLSNIVLIYLLVIFNQVFNSIFKK